jgi:hypothetical protein
MVLTAHDKPGSTGRKTGFWLGAQLYGDDIVSKNGAIADPQSAGFGLEPRADVIRNYRPA